MNVFTETMYQGYLDGLSDPRSGAQVQNRFSKNSENIDLVKAWMEDEMRKTGATTCTQTFKQGGSRGYDVHNVIGYVQGSEPGLVVLGAHYDTLPSTSTTGKAPGAVDNASGTAAVLAALKALMMSGGRPKKSIYFVAFGGEEQGLHGSRRLVQELKRPGSSDSPIPRPCLVPSAKDETIGVTMDMIGWRNPNFAQDTVLVETKEWSKDILAPLAMANRVLNGNSLKLLRSFNPFGSDHMSFLNNGYQGVLSIDNDGNTNQYRCYHRSCDDLTQIDYRLAKEISRMNMGAVLRLAGLREDDR